MEAGRRDTIVEWGIDRAGELLDLLDVAFPTDRLTLDELQAACWDQGDAERMPRVVLGRDDGAAVVALRGGGSLATIELIAGQERAAAHAPLHDAVLATARRWGATTIGIGGPVPDHLWPGLGPSEVLVDDVLAALGFRRLADADVVAVPTTFTSTPPDGTAIERVLDDEAAVAVQAWADQLEHESRGGFERPRGDGDEHDVDRPVGRILVRAIDQATCFTAVDTASRQVIGVAAHSVGRDGWIGPVLVASGARRRGVGAAMVAAACRDLMVAGWRQAPLAWWAPAPDGWPAGFLEAVGAQPWRSFGRWGCDLA